MGEFIVKVADHYLLWSTIVDAPVSWGLTREEFERFYARQYGEQGMARLPERMARVDRKGTSAFNVESADDTMWLNRAGPDEIALSKAEIIEWYVRRRKDPTATEIQARRAALPKCDPCIAGPDANGCGQMCRCWGTGVVDEAEPASAGRDSNPRGGRT